MAPPPLRYAVQGGTQQPQRFRCRAARFESHGVLRSVVSGVIT